MAQINEEVNMTEEVNPQMILKASLDAKKNETSIKEQLAQIEQGKTKLLDDHDIEQRVALEEYRRDIEICQLTLELIDLSRKKCQIIFQYHMTKDTPSYLREIKEVIKQEAMIEIKKRLQMAHWNAHIDQYKYILSEQKAKKYAGVLAMEKEISEIDLNSLQKQREMSEKEYRKLKEIYSKEYLDNIVNAIDRANDIKQLKPIKLLNNTSSFIADQLLQQQNMLNRYGKIDGGHKK